MSTADIKQALRALSGERFEEQLKNLLGVLGYRSERTPTNQTGNVRSFLRQLPVGNPGTASEKDFIAQAKSVYFLFQFSDDEIEGAGSDQSGLFYSKKFSRGNTKSFLFVAVDLKEASYPRGRYARFAREINKRLSAPTVVLFRSSTNLLTLAFARRRANKKKRERAVLENISLLREISSNHPHRAHLQILEELSLPAQLKWMDDNNKDKNFDGLLDAWLNTLDTEKLNKKFYQELFAWFERACEEARFPTTQRKTLPPQEHVIRLITRILFIWFIKEKGLISEDLFIRAKLKELLTNFTRADDDSYYRVVLQNLSSPR